MSAGPQPAIERVGVEQRHGEVADVRRLEGVHLRHDGADAGQAALAAQAGLGRAGGARGEEEIAERLGGHRTVGHLRRVRRRVGVERALRPAAVSSTSTRSLVRPTSPEGVADAGALHQGQVGRVGDQELALGVGQVAHQLVAAVGRVGPDHHGAGQGGRLEPEDELGHVVEHERDVEGAVLPRGTQPGCPRRRPGDHLGVAEAEVVRHQSEPVDVGQGRGRRPVMVSVSGAGVATGSDGCASAGVTASPNVSDLGWKSHYWNTLHFNQTRVTVAGAPAERTAAP